MQWGIDISHWNKLEDIWKFGNPQFIMAKLTEGKSMTDYTAYTYATYAKSLNINFGVYHFANANRNTVQTEIEHFLQEAEKLKAVIENIALDIEGNSLKYEYIDEWACEWLDKIKTATAINPMLYISQSQTKKFKNCTKYPLWVARYNKEIGNIEPWKDAKMWQYSSKGVDQNYKFY